MAPTRETLFDLFGDFTNAWPSGIMRERPGLVVGGTPSPAVWLAALNNSVRVQNVRTGALEDRVAIEAELTVDPATGFLGYPEGWPFVIVSMPDVEFRIRPFGASGRFVGLFASIGDTGVELLLEQLPVEIRLPAELVEPHPDEPSDPMGTTQISVGSFTPGNLDDLQVVYRRGAPTSIFVHIRLHVTQAGEFHIQPAVPVSFGRCALSAIPCKAVHDFRLMPSPALVPDHFEWVRHSVSPWLPTMTGPYDGLFAARSIDLDGEAAALQDVGEFLNRRTENTHPAAEFALDDLVVPFFGPFGVPVPRHITIGIRRAVLDPGSQEKVFAFERAPVNVRIASDPAIAFVVESLFYRSQPTAVLGEDLGLTFSAAIVFGEDESPQHAFKFGLEEDYTLVVGYQRDFSTSDGMPAPGTGAEAVMNTILHWEIAGTVILDIMGFSVGFSLGRRFGADKSISESLLLTCDIFVSMAPTGSDDASFRLRALNGEKVAFAIEGVGWRFGSFHLEGISMPDGVVAFFGPVGLIFSEIGLVAEEGATYFSFSGGLMIELPSGFEGGLTVRRLRFRVAGDETRPAVKVDGFFLFIRAPTLQIEAGGYYTQEQVGGTRVREFGLTGTIDFKLGEKAYSFGVDLIVGNRQSATEEFDYFMVQAFFRGQIGPIGYFELTGARILYASNMLPKLSAVDRESRDLRYFSWYKSSNPLTVNGDRRLASWRADRGSWAFGVGAGASLASLGKALELSIFVLGLGGPSESGFLVVGEVFALSSTQPLGYLALEWDGKNDRFSMVIGVDLRMSTFLPSAPAWISNVGKLTGTLFISNDPGTFAIGRLSDQRTWLGLRFDYDLWVRTLILFGACIEIVEGGPKGFGLVIRVEGGINAGVARLTYNAGIGFVVLVFSTGSTDFAVVIWIEAGIRFVLFGFLRIGVSARAEWRLVGRHPERGELSLELRLETPWFLPDVTWTLEVVFGTLAPADLATATQPLRSASATEGATRKQLPTHLERFDQSWSGEGVAPLHTLNELRASTRPEATRLANLAADASVRPVATDATIGIVWNVAVNDRLALGSGMASGLGDQRSGDLTLVYDLVGIAVQRRARFGSDRSWKALEQRVELGPDFSDPSGVQLGGSFAPQVLNKTWDVDIRVAGQPAPKKLLLNAVAPYEFVTSDPEADEELARQHPSWPCCETPDDKDLLDRLHEVDWRELAGGVYPAAPSTFSGSSSALRFQRPSWTRTAVTAGLPPGTIVAAVEVGSPGLVARADLDEDAAFCWVRWAWPRGGRAALVAFDAAGQEVGRQDLGPGTDSHQLVMLAGRGAIRRLELRALVAPQGVYTHLAADRPTGAAVEVDWVAYLGLQDALDLLAASETCDGGVPGGPEGFEGRGKLAFLPNHEYEVKLTTRVTVAHPSTPATSADVEEFVYFRTKGLPGLNAVARVGEEIEPYVRAAYTGGRGRRVYREEPVTLAFSEDFHVAVPLTVRPAGSSAEQTTLLRMRLLVTPDAAAEAGTVFTATGHDWVVEHRATTPFVVVGAWASVESVSETRASAMITSDPYKHRLAAMTQRATVPCGLEDPRRVVGTVLVAPPQGTVDPLASPPGSSELWVAGARFQAVVRAEGAGFVDRRLFAEGDETAFSFAVLGGPGSAKSWSVVDGELRASGAGRRFAAFGEPEWDHLTVLVGLAPGAASAGVGFGLPASGGAPSGLFALVEVAGGAARLVIRRREGGGALAEVDGIVLPAGLATGTAPVTLEVTSFDDRLRASVGDAVVEVDRGEIHAGRLCLTAEGPATFKSLRVRGLDLYLFPFVASRYRSFSEHVGSWDGGVDEIAPNALGSGTTTSTVAALWTASASDVAAVMSAAIAPEERERVFARWVREIGLPLKDDVTAFELSRFVESGQTRLLVIESPEPLDFIEEISARLVRRELVSPVVQPGPALLSGLERALRRPPRSLEASTIAATSLGDRLERLVQVSTSAHEPDRPGHGPSPEVAIRDAVPSARGIRVEVDPGLADAGEVIIARVEDDGSVRMYRGRVESRSRGGRDIGMVDAEPVDALSRQTAEDSVLAEVFAEAEAGTVVLFTPDLSIILGLLYPWLEDEPVDVRILQSGDGRRSLLVPIDGAASVGLTPGRYQLKLKLERQRWETIDPQDEINTYASEAVVSLSL
jgi:hypothetical protein